MKPSGHPSNNGAPRLSSSPMAFALLLVSIHLCLTIFFQIQNYCSFVLPLERGREAWVGFMVRMPFLQLENLLVATSLGFLFLLFRGNLLFRGLYFILFFALGFLVVIDQMAYGLSGNHLRLSLTESVNVRWDLVLDSFLAGATKTFWVEIAFWGLIGLWIFLKLGRFEPTPAETGKISRNPFRGGLFLLLFFAWLAASVLVQKGSYNAHLERHPLIVFVADALRDETPLPQIQKIPDFLQPRHGTFSETPDEQKSLRKARELLRNRRTPPHIIFIALESIGALQALKNGLPDPAILPHLQALANRAIVFDTIYTTFPATSRAHIPLITGGTTLTNGSVFKELVQPWAGATLLGELKKAGYHSGFFATADLDFENLDLLYQKLGFDTFFHYGIASASFKEKSRLNSWGGSEDSVFNLIHPWLETASKKGRPVFLQFVTNATHHPYSVPEHFNRKFPTDTDFGKYQGSILYVDDIIGKVVKSTQELGMYDDTVFVIMGDHGEAFGDRHKGNFLHKDALYEENVRTFFLISAPGILKESVISHRIGSLGDLMPTLLALVRSPLPAIVGQDLSRPEYSLRNVFFHKLASPARWGMRDGPWKFSANLKDPKAFELYNLASDPMETGNLAELNATQTRLYDSLCATWYAETETEYHSHILSASNGSGSGRIAEASGPLRVVDLEIGSLDEQGIFQSMPRVNPRQKLVAMAYLAGDPASKTFRTDWRNPLQHHATSTLMLESGWKSLTIPFPEARPMIDGKWELFLWDGAHLACNKTFIVDPRVRTYPLE